MYGCRVPLKNSLKLFLEVPGLFNKILNYIAKLSKPSDIITNFIQARLWTQKYSNKFLNNLVFPLYVFYDDLETGNALGSHAHAGTNKFGTIYVSIACLPPSISSKLSSIIFSTLIYGPLIDELKFLQTEGILINHDGVETRVKFQPVLILGDNLGLNGCYGFIESFTATFYCRVCKASSAQCKEMVEEDVSILRNKLNYAIGVATANAKNTGIKEVCVFHKLNDFHITENVSVDLMHDFLEGVAYYTLNSLLETFIFEKKMLLYTI